MPGVVRGCGTRVLGGVYLETLLGPDGHPIECFVKDPCIPVDPPSMGLTPVGIKLIETHGVTHVFDWVGEGYYPYVSDFIEEVRRFGASRRLPQTLDFSKLTPESRLVLIHSRASTLRPQDPVYVESPQRCPRAIKNLHDRVRETQLEHTCARVWWADHDATGNDGKRLLPGEEYDREMPSFTYKARQQEALYLSTQPAIFMVLPISRISVVRDPGTNSHEETAQKIVSKLSELIPLEVVDE